MYRKAISPQVFLQQTKNFNFQQLINVKNGIMLTSITLLNQNFSANHVDIMVFEHRFLSPPAAPFFWGGIRNEVQIPLCMVRRFNIDSYVI